MDLCTVISEKFIPQAINLIQSYKVFSYDKRVYLYHFNTDRDKLKVFHNLFGEQVVLSEVQKVCDHALEPRVFFYKTYSINDCLNNKSDAMIYSDSANCFVKETSNLESDLIDESLFSCYPYERLTNQYWTTKECMKVINAPLCEIMPQYWAGFQVYKRTTDNLNFVSEMYDLMLDPKVALPDTTIKNPDGVSSPCIEHRQEQSVLSILLHKHNRHQRYDIEKSHKYGDWQTMVSFDKTYQHDFSKMILSPRESKFGNFRFLK